MTYKNIIQGPPRVIRRKIKKDRKRGVETSKILSNTLEMTKQFGTKMDKEIFNI